jgi:imidazolonepropionase-like amidohydrolase
MELLRLSAAGLSNLEVITCATKNGAHLINKGDQLGTLQEGKLADVIVVKGNPAADIGALCNAVM